MEEQPKTSTSAVANFRSLKGPKAMKIFKALDPWKAPRLYKSLQYTPYSKAIYVEHGNILQTKISFEEAFTKSLVFRMWQQIN